MAKHTSKQFRCPHKWTLVQRLDHYIDKSAGPDACWTWMGGRYDFGYGMLKWKGKAWRAHRLVWINANGPIQPDKPHILHKCDVPACVNPDHLWAGTDADNVADMTAKGRARKVALKGEAHGNAKLTEADVRAIRSSADTQCDIAKRFGVRQTTVSGILSGKTWVHVL